ncbi:MAG TPA: hypothetical protein VE154_06260 [Chthoniobacterales bacterium]|nr:hypothetical protein [Chthoniobacterales bacterium]
MVTPLAQGMAIELQGLVCEHPTSPFGSYSQMVRIITLAILALALCSCADSYEILGLHLKRGDQYDNMGHGYVSGSGDPGN